MVSSTSTQTQLMQSANLITAWVTLLSESGYMCSQWHSVTPLYLGTINHVHTLIRSSGHSRLTEPFKQPCVCLSLFMSVGVAWAYRDLYVSVCLTCWLMSSTETLCKVHIAPQTGYAPGGVNPNSWEAFWVCCYALIQSDRTIWLTALKLW